MPTLVVSSKSKTYQPRYTDYIINWGGSKQYEYITNVGFTGNQIAVDKLKTFEEIKTWNATCYKSQYVNIPEFTTITDTAQSWVDDGILVMGRKTLTGHSGQGIILFDSETITSNLICPLYVKYIKKRHEYRVHVFDGSVIDVTQKKKRKDAEFLDTKIRNHSNGWVYAREGITVTDELLRTAINSIEAVGLQFGAVDIIWNEKSNLYYTLEVNTAPGLVGTTLQKYTEKFIEDIKEKSW